MKHELFYHCKLQQGVRIIVEWVSEREAYRDAQVYIPHTDDFWSVIEIYGHGVKAETINNYKK